MRRVLLILAPLVAVLTMMVGLRIGAGDAVRAATVFGAPLGRPGPDGSVHVAWQVLTFLDDRTVKETIPITGLTAVARANGHEARWSGASNQDGVAEIDLVFPRLAPGDRIELEMRAASEPLPLAHGVVAWRMPAPGTEDGTGSGPSAGSLGGERRVLAGGAVRPTSRKGSPAVDVVIEGDRLVAGFPTSLWIRTTPALGGAEVTLDPEPGLLAERTTARTCASGWAELAVTAQAHVIGAGVKVASAPGAEPGSWFGALPVAPGAFFVSAPRVLPAGTPADVVLIAPNPRDVVYAELDDVRGRVVAAALPVATMPGDPTPRATFALPALAPGLYWVVASGEPRGAEHLTGATITKAIWVGDAIPDAPTLNVHDACSLGPYLAQRSATGTPRWVALDGLPERSARNRTRHTWGLLIGTGSLTLAGVLVTLLMIAAAREARVAMQLAELDEDASADKVTAAPPGGSAAVGILVALLGLALLAVLLIAKG